jgi:hypothetical protein
MPGPLILAIDCATVTGLCSGRPGETPVLETVRFGDNGASHFEIGARALRWVAFRLRDERPDQIWIEEPISFAGLAGKTNKNSLVRLNGLFLLIGSAARLKGVPVHLVKVNEARKNFIGKGRLKGAEAKRRCRGMCKQLGWAVRNDDESDAAAIWWVACAANAPELVPPISPMMHAQLAGAIG